MGIVISFTGSVGSGKSFCSKQVASYLFQQGLPAYYLRFRHITPLSFFRQKRQVKKVKVIKRVFSQEAPRERFQDFKYASQLLFPLSAIYYLYKCYLFFLLIKVRYPNDIVIVDRYVYDHLTHFSLKNANIVKLSHWLMKLLPRPDLSFFLFSDIDELITVRHKHSEKYLRKVADNYRRLQDIFPEEVHLSMSPVYAKADRSIEITRENLAKYGYDLPPQPADFVWPKDATAVKKIN